MHEKDFSDVIDVICTRDPRYLPDAYYFIREALDFAVRMHKKPTEGVLRHVSAAELLEGIRVYALQEYGPMTLTVLQSWGLTCTEDIGEVVFNLVESGKLGRTENDRKEDFGGGYDFASVFARPFQPRQPDTQPEGPSSEVPEQPETAETAAGETSS